MKYDFKLTTPTFSRQESKLFLSSVELTTFSEGFSKFWTET